MNESSKNEARTKNTKIKILSLSKNNLSSTQQKCQLFISTVVHHKENP
jgi:hypothetical protein